MARIGYAARGVVFMLIASFAGFAALGSATPKGTRGVLQTLLVQPIGGLLLWVIAGGLFCFAGWRFVEAIFDVDHYGSQMRGIVRRAGVAGSGFFSLIIAGLAVSVVFGLPGDDDKAARDWTAWLLAQPFGQWTTALIGVCIAASGIGQVAKPTRIEFRKQLALRAGPRGWVVALGIVGFVGRAVVFVIIGTFLVTGAIRINSGEAAGFAGALRALQQQPYGSLLLGVTAFGLFAFGLFQCTEAVWRRIDVPKVREVSEKLA